MAYDKFLIPVYTRVGPTFVRGRGSFLWTKEGKKYLDLFPGWGVSILGHSHPQIAKVLSEQAKTLIHLPNNLTHQWQGRLAGAIVKESFPSKVFFANSGAEGIEAALKFSRLYGKGKRYEIITMRNSFHGRTFAALSCTGQGKYKKSFKPLLKGVKVAKFNDFNDFKKKVTKKTVALIIELIQGEGGVNVAEKVYVQKLRKFCKAKDILFIVDEVQTGMGRTGTLFSYQGYGIKPDIMVLSKGLGAGVPISCTVVKKAIADMMQPGHHASTFGGNPLVTRVALEVFAIIKKEKLLRRTLTMGHYLKKRLHVLQKQCPIIKEVRGEGLMIGIELNHDASVFFKAALKKGLIINATHTSVLRIMPALTCTKKELDKGLDIIETVLRGAS